MAEAKRTFPSVPAAHWWALRKKFQQTIPGVVTSTYIASVLKMQEDSARANVLPGLRFCKIIDVDGKPTERAKQWRDDTLYPGVCEAILRESYPEELLDAIPDPAADKDGASRWFANHSGAGAASVKKMVQFYTLLTEKDPSKASEAPKANGGERSKAVSATREPRKAQPAKIQKPDPPPPPPPPAHHGRTEGPPVHINLQIHISADASADQIDQVFKSLAQHVYKSKSE